MNWQEKYQERISSFQWRGLKMRLLNERGNFCERCKNSGLDLELHHLTYERLGEELDSDLQLLCRECHIQADIEREQQSRERSFRARHSAGLNTWATKKYGEDWIESDYADSIAEEFDDWVERKNW